MSATTRGPKRNGLFALWLFVRLCAGRNGGHGLSDRAHRRRVELLERRLSSLSLPAPLRRALTAAIRDLKERQDAVPVALQQLVAPVRETLGGEPGDAVATAARTLRDAARAASV